MYCFIEEKFIQFQVFQDKTLQILHSQTFHAINVSSTGNVSSTLTSSTGTPQVTVLSPIVFTLYTADFHHDSESCPGWKLSDDTAFIACIRENEEGEYRKLVSDFTGWCGRNLLQMNTLKTKAMVLDF